MYKTLFEIKNTGVIATIVIVWLLFSFSTPLYLTFFKNINHSNIQKIIVTDYQETYVTDTEISDPEKMSSIIDFLNNLNYGTRLGENRGKDILHINLLHKNGKSEVIDVYRKAENLYGITDWKSLFGYIVFIDQDGVEKLNTIIDL